MQPNLPAHAWITGALLVFSFASLRASRKGPPKPVIRVFGPRLQWLVSPGHVKDFSGGRRPSKFLDKVGTASKTLYDMPRVFSSGMLRKWL